MNIDNVVACLIQNGDALRKAGVRDLRVGDIYVTLAAPDQVAETTDAATDEDDGDPLNDPLTFGRKRGVPGFPREADQ
jgi:hypothetical protein